MRVELGICLLLLVSCGEETNAKKEYYSAIEATDENQEEYMDENAEAIEKAEKELEEAKKNATSMKLDKMVHDFGTIKLNSENDCVFKVTNTGKTPLIISDIQASCGCTTPQKPEKPIPAGKSDVIKIHFKPSTQSVDGKPIEKTVTITANTDPRLTVVKIKSIVL